jgi:uncharacterized protein (DUF2126 family)
MMGESFAEFSPIAVHNCEQTCAMNAYTSEQWQSINALGRQVDETLKHLQVGLTMGGEPTYVSATDFESLQWRFEALGEDKRRIAEQLLHRLRDEFAPTGALLHYGLGKLYPGEPYPRWALGCFWREDGQPLWPPRITSPHQPELSLTVDHGQTFIERLAQRLGIPGELVLPAYEADATEPAGFVLPILSIQQSHQTVWGSCRWQFADGPTPLTLSAGEISIGMRLPLAQLRDMGQLVDEAEQPLGASPAVGDPEMVVQPANSIQVALCVEVEDSGLRVFMPPMTSAGGYVGLLTAIEQVALAMGCPVTIEGYRPPVNQGIQGFQITPDPGVLEINIHPAATWDALVQIHTTLDRVTEDLGLGAIKFARDGRTIGTGGGSHITLGGRHPDDSPLLRRPDLLQSFITYWQHHPSLSYLFAGEFIGPTCQSPRVDESHHDNLYHLEMAFAALLPGQAVSPAVVDHLLRPLLTDLTGNSHRTAFCIDKLFPANALNLRLGLLELRGFEMTPTSQMRLLQMLLVRACMAWFWQTPYRQPLHPWGEALYDRFMLPHYLEADLATVLADLHRAGYAFQAEWFQPFWEFRFPQHAPVRLARAPHLMLELRHALEPWPVVEPLDGVGSARMVDDSLARLQVQLRETEAVVSAAGHQRYVLLCNGQRVPLQPGALGTCVGGVRYRARALHWQALQAVSQGCSSAVLARLQQQFQPVAQLRFEVFDSLERKALGGCTYQVARDDGEDYLTWPTSAPAAQQRWQGRVIPYMPAGMPASLPTPTINPHLPNTLDLRYSGAP